MPGILGRAEAEEAKVAILATVGVNVQEPVEKEFPRASSFRSINGRAAAIGANGVRRLCEVEVHGYTFWG